MRPITRNLLALACLLTTALIAAGLVCSPALAKCGKDCHYPKAPGLDSETLRPAVSCGEIIEPAAPLVNPLHRLAVAREEHDGAVIDDDLHLALVVRDP